MRMGLEDHRGGCVPALMVIAGGGASLLSGPALVYGSGLPVDTTLEDFFMPGTQPDPTGLIITPFLSGIFDCSFCHGDFESVGLPLDAEPYRNWAGSMMAQAARDPVAWAAITIANQDADFGGDICIRCHSPAGWLGGRSVPTDGLGLAVLTTDFEGVTCHVCHRLVNPMFVPGESPAEDAGILADLDANCPPDCFVPQQPGTARYVIDPQDRRRGPFDLVEGFPYHDWRKSPFHQTAELCATCHDVENPLYLKQPDGSYLFTTVDLPHPSMDKYEMFPLERTFSEFANSDFANGGVQINDRFGTTGLVETCQDCHMPDRVSDGCIAGFSNEHDDMPAHFLKGGNTWVLNAVNTLYTDLDPPDDPPNTYNDPVFTDDDTGLTPDIITDALDRTTQMLRDASDMDLCQVGNVLNVRNTNMCGHKLPTGYPEGRRMWINVKFLDDNQELLLEYGHYDFTTADLTTSDTEVYEAKMGLDAAAAALTGLPEGEGFHFILNNTIYKDNRIPPQGFTNAAFDAVQAAPVGSAYADGQHWDDTGYLMPQDAAEAVVTLYFQTTSKEHIEFLRDENVTDSRGQIAYDQWVLHGKSAPVDMDSAVISLAPAVPGDLNNDGIVDVVDILLLLGNYGTCPNPCQLCCPGDTNGDCEVNVTDLLAVPANWTV